MPKASKDSFVSLKPLYDFVFEHRFDEQPLRGKGNRYGAFCAELTRSIPREQGFYLWGYYDKARAWHSLYLGKVGFGKSTSLQARICEELRDERWFVWRRVFTKKQIRDFSNELFPSQTHLRACDRALLKTGATHVVWATTNYVSKDDVLRIEADLIEAINPTANLSRPTPPSTVKAHATKIFQSFRKTIHAARLTAFSDGPAA